MDRRTIIALGGLSAGGLLVAGPAIAAPLPGAKPDPGPLATPQLHFAFEARVTVGTPLEQGSIDGVRRRIIPITGGRFEGPRLSGEVVNGGADWQSIRADGTAEIFARYTLRATDGTLISVENPGIRRGPEAVMRRLAAGESVDPALYYFRTSPRFSVAPGPHRWLADSVFVASGARYRDHVIIRVFAVD